MVLRGELLHTLDASVRDVCRLLVPKRSHEPTRSPYFPPRECPERKRSSVVDFTLLRTGRSHQLLDDRGDTKDSAELLCRAARDGRPTVGCRVRRGLRCLLSWHTSHSNWPLRSTVWSHVCRRDRPAHPRPFRCGHQHRSLACKRILVHRIVRSRLVWVPHSVLILISLNFNVMNNDPLQSVQTV